MPNTKSPSSSSGQAHVQARPTDAPTRVWKRALVFALIAALVWLALSFRRTQPKIVYASRYSKEFKYRPAASPVITELLKDGRVRLRGALPT